MTDLRKRLEAKRDEVADAYQKADFEQNPDGYTVAPYVNCHVTSEAVIRGANEFIPMIVELADALRSIEHELADDSPLTAGNVAVEVLDKLNAWLGGE